MLPHRTGSGARHGGSRDRRPGWPWGIVCVALAFCLPGLLPQPSRAQSSQAPSGAAQAPSGAAQLRQGGTDTSFPQRRFGLWEVRETGLGLGPAHQCVGELSDEPSNQLGRQVGTRGSCALGPFRRSGAGWVGETVCREGKTTVTSVSVVTGNMYSEYRIDTQVTYDPPLGGTKKEDKEAVVARYLGPCLAHQRVGDTTIPGYGTLNMFDGTFRAEPAPPSSHPPPAHRGAGKKSS